MMPGLEVDKQMDQMIEREAAGESSDDKDNEAVDEWIPPPPKFWLA
jgi:hypothetical protein